MSGQHGTAMTESLIGLLAIIPAFLAMDHLGRLQDMERAAIAGARYAAWEEISGRGKDDALPIAIEDRIFGNDHAPIVDRARLRREGVSQNPLWQDRDGMLRDTDADGIQRQDGRKRGNSNLPEPGTAVRNIAYGQSIPDVIEATGLSGDMLGLPRETLVGHRLRMGARPRLEEGDRNPPLVFEAQGAISPGHWQAGSDRAYQRRTERIVASEPVDTLSKPAQALGGFFVFKEGRYARSTDFVPRSDLFPTRH
ncbi:hypothetical protein [Spiribacter vilamensis]|uniref:Uncharacterized protein n=1 Tax=Spiribacter vilamensis TaxID=531306 RepID=A0A4Q8D010_9GAMM|nr:hypothetical protein [Spiribacter vilamensis]RZU98641.1 hypothetical protein EV698_0896 [Spiribacter vilamensis]TVO60101.1 hypothetical protein FPL09_09715 [Spiribacter vilamensis]